MKKNCPFCNIQDRVIKENKLAFIILSNPRKMPGHFLVIPKRHVEKPWELTQDEVLAISELIFFTQKRIAEKLNEGCDVRQNYRPFLKQSKLKIDHTHYHVMPREFEDKLYEKVEKHETDMFEDLSDEEHNKIAKILE